MSEESNDLENQPKMTKQEAINQLRKEAKELEEEKCSIKQYASNAYRAKIRRKLADKLEKEWLDDKNKINQD